MASKKLEQELAAAEAAMAAEREEETQDYAAVVDARGLAAVADRLSPESRAEWLAQPKQREKVRRAADAEARIAARRDRKLSAEAARQAEGRPTAA